MDERLREDVPRGTRTAKSCGPDAPTLASNSQEASFLRATVAIKPVTGESAKETVKPLRRECRRESGEPVDDLVLSLHETTGALGTRHSLRPLTF
jgi:hypothetical protein